MVTASRMQDTVLILKKILFKLTFLNSLKKLCCCSRCWEPQLRDHKDRYVSIRILFCSRCLILSSSTTVQNRIALKYLWLVAAMRSIFDGRAPRTHIYIYIYIYIYINRERDIYIYIYIGGEREIYINIYRERDIYREI